MARSSANSSAGTAAMSTSPRTATAGAFCSWASTTSNRCGARLVIECRRDGCWWFAGVAVDGVVSRHKRQHLVESAHLNRFVGRSRRCDERQLESVALRALVERDQQAQTRGVDEGQAAQIEHQAPGILDSIQRGAQRLNGGKVEFAAGPHDRDIVAPLHVDRERLRASQLDRRRGSRATRAVG